MATANNLTTLAASVIEMDGRATPGAWTWNVNLASKHIYLESHGRGHRFEYVMDFARWGMGGAAPRFRSEQDLMERADDLTQIVPGREHHADWFRTLDHPDAALIASYRTAAPKLARAVMALLPHVRHYYNDENGEGCARYIDDREPCTCGLDAALAALDEGEKGTI